MPSAKQVQDDEIEELQSIIDEAQSILEEAYTPEATRADLVAAVSQAIDVLSGEEAEAEEESEEDEEG